MRLEEKLRDEKEKYEKKISNLIEDYENKLKDQENELKEENENLQNDLNDLNQGHNQFVTNAEHEFEMLNQKVITLNASLKEAKDNLNLETEKNKNNLDQLTEQCNNEVKEGENNNKKQDEI